MKTTGDGMEGLGEERERRGKEFERGSGGVRRDAKLSDVFISSTVQRCDFSQVAKRATCCQCQRSVRDSHCLREGGCTHGVAAHAATNAYVLSYNVPERNSNWSGERGVREFTLSS